MRQVHAPATIAVQEHPSGSDCVGCHMPKRRAEDVVHAVMTDHLIQRRPAANLLAEFPERHAPGLEYRGEVSPYGDQDDLYTAVAQVTHKSNLEAGIPRLQAEIARRKPERPEVYMELGDALQRAGRSEESAAAYRVAIEKRPASALLWARLAMPLRALGKSQEPLEAMLKSVQMDPNQAENWYNLALLQSDLGDKKSAIDSFRRSIALDSEFAESQTDLGAVLAETGQVREAETQFRRALTIRPALPAAHAHLAHLLANRGDFIEAIWHFERAGDGAVNQFSYGVTLARMNRLAKRGPIWRGPCRPMRSSHWRTRFWAGCRKRRAKSPKRSLTTKKRFACGQISARRTWTWGQCWHARETGRGRRQNSGSRSPIPTRKSARWLSQG